MKYNIFAGRNIKELLRDPISYIFCIGLPILMLFMMSIVNSSIPKEANMEIFNINYLASGITVFGFSFVMLFACLLVSKDRTTTFLSRLYTSPMKASDYILGYTLPLLIIALFQAIVTFSISAIIGIFTGVTFNILNVLLSFVTLIPTAVLFIGFGILFGSLFNDKSAPPVSSMIITVAALLGGIWMDVNIMNDAFKTVCKVLPFYHAVNASRSAVLGNFEDIWTSFLIVSAYALCIFILAVVVFKKKMQSDAK